jgi:hypothetical protein
VASFREMGNAVNETVRSLIASGRTDGIPDRCHRLTGRSPPMLVAFVFDHMSIRNSTNGSGSSMGLTLFLCHPICLTNVRCGLT